MKIIDSKSSISTTAAFTGLLSSAHRRTLLTIIAAIFAIIPSIGSAATYTVTGSINWSNLRTLVTPNADPTSADGISCATGATITVNVSNAICSSIVVSHTGVLLFASGSQLTIGPLGYGTFTLGAGGGGAKYGTLNMSSGGTLNCGAINSLSGSNVFTITAGTINLGAACCAVTLPFATYNNLTISGPGERTLSAATTVNGNLTINSGATLNSNGFDINLKGNWNNNGNFFFGTRTITFSGTSAQTISGSITTFYHIAVANAAGVSMQASAFVNGNVNLSGGSLDIATYSLILGTTSNITNATSTRYIKIYNSPTTGGSVCMYVASAGTKVFPVGTSSYTPVTVNNIGAADNFFVSVCNGVYADGTGGSTATSGVDRTWMVSKAMGGVANVTLTMQWSQGDEIGSFSRGSCGVYHYTGGTWEEPTSFAGASGSGSGPFTISRSGISSFSPFAVSDGMTPLPVELISFSAKAVDKVVELNWATATEVNNSHFNIERSADGKDFEAIGRVEGSGNSNSIISYEFTDNDPVQNSISYYRLKQVDYDGTSSYSQVQITKHVQYINLGDAYPMPVKETLTIPLQNALSGSFVVEIHELAGRILYTESFNLPAGSQNLVLPTADLPQGMYVLSIRNNEEVHSLKLVK